MPNELTFFIVIVLGFFILFFFLNKKLNDLKNNSSDKTLLEWLKTMHQTIETTNRTVNTTLSENAKQLNERLDRAAVVFRDVGEKVGQMSEIGRSMKDLQEFLKSPKLRGNIGEHVLKDLIAQMFPKNSFNLQYQFKTGDRVDAAIKTDGGILPIDSKFPMENFQRMIKTQSDEERKIAQKEFVRDVKKHISAISQKYILPDEGTMDFALMYLPSESVYYEVVNLTDIMDFARRNRVYPVSPSTLYAHLQTILLSFEGKKIEDSSRQVFKLLRALQIDYEKVDENLEVLGKHLNNATAQFSNVSTGFTQFGNKLQKTQMIEEKPVKKSQ
ncbi:MAG: DNA recombination protein RmuC [Candidatus Levybacteria bacterium]|nr:DNA recombination protein RmuC [Candidatus Levybacteria bacterium]